MKRSDWEAMDDFEEEERHLRWVDRMRLLHGVSDFVKVVIGLAVILAATLLLVGLIGWLKQDIGAMIANFSKGL